MQTLVQRVTERLKTQRSTKSFAEEVERIWPLTPTEKSARDRQKQAIEGFAAANGWQVQITDLGLRVTFKPAEAIPGPDSVPLPA